MENEPTRKPPSKAAQGFARDLKRAKRALEIRQALRPGGFILTRAITAPRAAQASPAANLDRERCATCGAAIPPGKAGRDCKMCRDIKGEPKP